MTEIVFSDTLPVSTIELQKTKAPKYFTEAAVSTLHGTPNRWARLAGGHWVDRAYVPKLKEQAEKIDPRFEVQHILMKKGPVVNPESGKKSYEYKGEVWARFNCPESKVAVATEPKKKKNKKKNKNKES